MPRARDESSVSELIVEMKKIINYFHVKDNYSEADLVFFRHKSKALSSLCTKLAKTALSDLDVKVMGKHQTESSLEKILSELTKEE